MNKTIINRESLAKIWQVVLASLLFILGFYYTGIQYTQLKALGIIISIVAMTGLFIYGNVEIDLQMLLIFTAFFLIGFHNSRNWIDYEVPYAWILVWPYIIGKLAIGNDKAKADRNFYRNYYCMSAGMMLLGFAEIIRGKILGLYASEYFWNLWNGEYYSRTTHEYNYVFIIGSLVFALMLIMKNNKKAWIIVALDAYIVVAMVMNEGRYSLTYTIIQIPMFIFVLLVGRWKSFDKTQRSKVIKALLTAIGTIIVLLILFRLNIFGLYKMYKNSYLVGGGSVFHNQRYDFLVAVIKAIPDNLLGGFDYASPEGSHNMWLEYGDKYGVFILVLLLMFKLLTFIDAFLLMIKSKTNLKYLVIPSFLYLHLYYTLEPNGFAHREFLIFGLFYWGMIRARVELEDKGDYELALLKDKANIDVKNI